MGPERFVLGQDYMLSCCCKIPGEPFVFPRVYDGIVKLG